MSNNSIPQIDSIGSGSKIRIRALDVLRGIAVLLVLGRHILEVPDILPESIKWPILLWRKVGWVGVDLFFVLSGFLVSGLLLSDFQNHGRLHLGRFLIRRALKIYPPFYLMLIATLAFQANFKLPIKTWSFFCEVIFIQNYGGRVWNHTWRIQV